MSKIASQGKNGIYLNDMEDREVAIGGEAREVVEELDWSWSSEDESEKNKVSEMSAPRNSETKMADGRGNYNANYPEKDIGGGKIDIDKCKLMFKNDNDTLKENKSNLDSVTANEGKLDREIEIDHSNLITNDHNHCLSEIFTKELSKVNCVQEREPSMKSCKSVEIPKCVEVIRKGSFHELTRVGGGLNETKNQANEVEEPVSHRSILVKLTTKNKDKLIITDGLNDGVTGNDKISLCDGKDNNEKMNGQAIKLGGIEDKTEYCVDNAIMELIFGGVSEEINMDNLVIEECKDARTKQKDSLKTTIKDGIVKTEQYSDKKRTDNMELKSKKEMEEIDDESHMSLSKLVLHQKGLLRKHESHAKVGFRGLIKQHPKSVREEMNLHIISRNDSNAVIIGKQKKQIEYYLAFIAEHKQRKWSKPSNFANRTKYRNTGLPNKTLNRDNMPMVRYQGHPILFTNSRVQMRRRSIDGIIGGYCSNHGNDFCRQEKYNDDYDKYENNMAERREYSKRQRSKNGIKGRYQNNNDDDKVKYDSRHEHYHSDEEDVDLSPRRYSLVRGKPPTTIVVPRGHYDRVQCHGCDKRFRWNDDSPASVHSRLGKRRTPGELAEYDDARGGARDKLRLWNEIGDAKQNWKRRYPEQDAGARYSAYRKSPLLSTPKRGTRMPTYRVGDKREIKKCPLNCDESESCNLCMANKYKYD